MAEPFVVNTDITLAVQFAGQHLSISLEESGRQRITLPHALLDWIPTGLVNSVTSIEQFVLAYPDCFDMIPDTPSMS